MTARTNEDTPPEPLDVFGCPLAGVNLIEASAGTGKTWTICGLYLRLLLERELGVQQILVVTFTNAATAELRERIRSRIVELRGHLNGAALPPVDPFIARLSGDLLRRGHTAPNLAARLDLALAAFDEAAIFTIHGFCQRALADNPFAAGLPMRTDIVESDRDLLMETVHDFWRRHVAHDSVRPEFARHLHGRKDSPEKYARLLERHLAKPLARHRWPGALRDPPLAGAVLHRPYREARAQWLDHGAQIIEQLTAALGSLHATTYKRESLRAAATEWDALCRGDDPLAAVGDKARLFRHSLLTEKTKKNGVTPSHPFFALAETYLALREQLHRSLDLERCRLLERLFAEGSRALRTLKRTHRVAAFNDLLANVHERLHHPGHPWLAASIRARFPAALIDEFQDTDPLQLAIFRTIYDTGGTAGTGPGGDSGVDTAASGDAGPAPDAVFLVGDPKQAIYAFRHADLHSYLRATRWASRRWSLTDNQRSSAPLLSALNTLFGANPEAFVLPEVQYRRVAFGSKPRARFVDHSGPRAPLQGWRLPDHTGPLSKPLARKAAVDATAAEIARLVQAGLDAGRDAGVEGGAGGEGGITLDGRPLRPKDIAVLVRSRSLGGEVKRALAALRVGAVELSSRGIFHSPEAKDWEVVRTAIASPTREALLRTALATELFGCDASQIERIAASDALLSERLLEFNQYRDLWMHRGFGVMYRRLFGDQAVAKRLLAGRDGERRLTNLLHVGEQLQQAAESQTTPEALLRWLQAVQQGDHTSDAAQLRLESDRNLVQIVTVHACKGLEYPIVFCPFLCDGGTKSGGRDVEGYEYHDDLEPVIDFNLYEDRDPALAVIKSRIAVEHAAETVRLLYVALTRAVHRCYLVLGPYRTTRPKDESARSLLNWLAAGGGMSFEGWSQSTLTMPQLDAAWNALAAASHGDFVIDPLPTGPGLPLRSPLTDAAELSTSTPPGHIGAGWRLSSYSGLSHGARSEAAAGDHDARTLPTPAAALPPIETADDDILRFPRGPDAGECIHAVFETIDFADPVGWQDAIAAALAGHPQGRADDPRSPPAGTPARMLRRLVEDVTAANLRGGLALATVPRHRRLNELEFNLPAPCLAAGALNAALAQWGYAVPTLTFGVLEGYLKGYIDLVFEHHGRYFIADWKSNHLGYAAADYGGASLARAMADHGYHLQYLLYVLAIDRYLALRVPGYRYETHFGGVFYLFVRGVRPAWPGDGEEIPGVYFHRPIPGTIRALNRLLGAAGAAVNR